VQTWAYNTMLGNGNGMFIGNSSAAQSTDEYVFANNIFIGVARDGQQPFFLWVADGTPIMKITYHNNLVWNTRSTNCDGVGILCKDPLLTSETLTGFNPRLLPSSPAIDAADTAYITNHDETGMPRPVGVRNDVGAVEYRGQPWLVPDSSPVPAGGGTGQQGAPAYSDPAAPQDGGTPTGGTPIAAPGGGVLSPDYAQPGSHASMLRQERVDGSRWFTRQDTRLATAHPVPSADAQELSPVAPPRAGARADANTAMPPAQAGKASNQRSYLAIVYDWFADLYQRIRRH
ncbi:MAG TPA: choice-of-anchor Q domain-containing protein, partial [Rhodanobacteraceae bacterium]|nr:choice-of-anchor Q domain-containing protein [Rhodanobacteraceae bacterium]